MLNVHRSLLLSISPPPPPRPPVPLSSTTHLPLTPPPPPHTHTHTTPPLVSVTPGYSLAALTAARRNCSHPDSEALKFKFNVALTSTETVRTNRDGEPRTATSIFTQLLCSDLFASFVCSMSLYVHRDRTGY